MDLRLLGLISIAAIVVVAAVPLLSQPLDLQDSVSRSWSRSRRTWLVTAIAMSLAGTGISTSLAFWAIPHYSLPAFMYAVVAIAYIAFMGIAWVPMTDRPGEHSYWHGHFLGGSVVATLAIVAMATVVWFGASVPAAARIACIAAMMLAASWPFLFIGPARRVFLLLESSIAVAFSVAAVLLLVGC